MVVGFFCGGIVAALVGAAFLPIYPRKTAPRPRSSFLKLF